MRVVRVAATGLAAGTLVLAGSSAAFGANGGLGVVQAQPSPSRPGAIVTVYDGAQCAGTAATAVSRAFTGSVTMAPLAGMLGGSATIANVPGGKYVITVTCGGGKTFTGFTNVTGNNPSGNPTGGAATGDGASQASVTSPIAGGALLAAAGAGLGFIALRRRASRNN